MSQAPAQTQSRGGMNLGTIVATSPSQVNLVAVTGAPGAGVHTLARMLCRQGESLEMSMGAPAWLTLEAEKGVRHLTANDQRKYLDLRIAKAKEDRAHWVRPFHKRLRNLINQRSYQRIVITGIITPYELAYCRAMGAKLIHLTAPEEVRHRRIGLRFLRPAHPAQELLERYMKAHPEKWNLVVDTDEPYGEFVYSVQSTMEPMLR